MTETAGGWVWWLRQVREQKPECETSVKELLQMYIKGVKWEDI